MPKKTEIEKIIEEAGKAGDKLAKTPGSLSERDFGVKFLQVAETRRLIQAIKDLSEQSRDLEVVSIKLAIIMLWLAGFSTGAFIIDMFKDYDLRGAIPPFAFMILATWFLWKKMK